MRLLARLFVGIIGLTAAPARAQFTISNHSADGGGSAQLFDGGPPVADSDSVSGPDNDLMSFSAIDVSGDGPSAAFALAGGSSQITNFGDFMSVYVELDALYAPSTEPGGDRPGATADAALSSLIEFPAPAGALHWFYLLDIGATSGFSGSANVVVENVTRAQTLLVMDSHVRPTTTILSSTAGDLIRITTDLAGTGIAPADADSIATYSPTMRMDFLIIPEPATQALAAAGILILLRRRRMTWGGTLRARNSAATGSFRPCP